MSGQYNSNDGSWGSQGGAWGSPPPPPPPRGMGLPPGMGMGGPMGMGMPPGMGMSGHRRQSSGGGMASAGSGGFDGPSWGQVAAAGSNMGKPPPPPPNQPTAQEEWPELGAGPKGAGSGPLAKEGSGKMPIFKVTPPLPLLASTPMVHPASSLEILQAVGGIQVSVTMVYPCKF